MLRLAFALGVLLLASPAARADLPPLPPPPPPPPPPDATLIVVGLLVAVAVALVGFRWSRAKESKPLVSEMKP